MERRRYVTLATWAYERRQRIEDASIPHEHPGEASREAGDPTQPVMVEDHATEWSRDEAA